MQKAKTSDRTRDIRCVAKLLRDGGYSYDQSKHLIAEARRRVGLTPPQRKKGSVERLTHEEIKALLSAAYATSGIRSLLETGSRVGAFCQLCVEDISFAELEIRVRDKGGKTRDVPILQSLANELRIHLGDRRTGFVFPSPRGGPYSRRRVQQIVKQLAAVAAIRKRVYPHLLRHTIAQRLADQGNAREPASGVPRAREPANDPGLLPGVPASSEASLPRGDGARRVMASWWMGIFPCRPASVHPVDRAGSHG